MSILLVLTQWDCQQKVSRYVIHTGVYQFYMNLNIRNKKLYDFTLDLYCGGIIRQSIASMIVLIQCLDQHYHLFWAQTVFNRILDFQDEYWTYELQESTKKPNKSQSSY